MNRQVPELVDSYDYEVIRLINEKYNMSFMDALRAFVSSETHRMLLDADYGFTMFGAPGIFDIWEAEMITGDPRNSSYIRG
ncbi:MAG: hypothetical protein IKX75_09610 [Desulfovibrio sp.]|nr:hypothetical protein [Desulfovibrio sp.]